MTEQHSERPMPDWVIQTKAVPDTLLKGQLIADPATREAIARDLDLAALKALSFDYGVKNLGQGRYRLKGRIVADVVQSCVVTLEPVEGHIDEPIEVEFRPDVDPKAVPGEIDLDDGEDIEPIINGRMEVGTLVYETLASSLDPYPRKPGASFRHEDPMASGDKGPNPFAILAKLKKDQ